MTLSPVYTEKTVCQDCYRCLRICPVKAIRVRDGHAEVIGELCLNCGRCLTECPAGAKKIRSDVDNVKALLALGRNVVVSLAPSWITEFPDGKRLKAKLSETGLHRIEETAIGARIIVNQCRENPDLAHGISTACPVIVEYINRYRTELVPLLSPLVSPLEAHARSVKSRFGRDTAVVFIGPCVAKKLEADNPDSYVDIALTYRELRDWIYPAETDALQSGYQSPDRIAHRCDDFFIEGGFLRVLEEGDRDMAGVALSGLDNVIRSLNALEIRDRLECPPLELMACADGCHNGPGTARNLSPLERKIVAEQKSRFVRLNANGKYQDFQQVIPAVPVVESRGTACSTIGTPAPEASAIRNLLSAMGRSTPEEDPDCGSCGYGSCREFAAAVIGGMAEESMCVTLMRRRAQNRNDALMRYLPLGAVIVDSDLHIRDCNRRFLRFFTDIDFDPPERIRTAVCGSPLSGFMQSLDIVRQVSRGLLTGYEGIIESGERIYRAAVFPIGVDGDTGAVFQDITESEERRDTVARKTEEVIRKNLASVQQIASLLGENAAETQSILDSLIETFHG